MQCTLQYRVSHDYVTVFYRLIYTGDLEFFVVEQYTYSHSFAVKWQKETSYMLQVIE